MPTLDLLPSQRRILASGRWFAGLPVPFRQALCNSARVVQLSAGDVLFRRGDDNDGLYGVIHGAVRVGVTSPAGKERVVGMLEPPQWFGEPGLLNGSPRSPSAWANSDTTLAHVPRIAISRWLANHPADWRYIGQLAVDRIRILFAAVEDASLYSPRERLIRILVSLADAYGQRTDAPTRTLKVSQERLGTMLSLSRQTVNALLRQLQREQVLASVRGGVRILDFARLRELESSVR